MKIKSKKTKISRIITIRLFIAVFIAFVVSTAVTYIVLHYNCEQSARDILKYNNWAFSYDIQNDAKQKLFQIMFQPALSDYVDEGEEAVKKQFEGSSYTYLAHRDGTIFISGNPEFLGQNVRDIEGVSGLIDSLYQNPYAASDAEISYDITFNEVKTLDGKEKCYYMVAVLYSVPDVILVAGVPQDMLDGIGEYCAQTLSLNRTIGLTGGQVIIDKNNNIFPPSTSEEDNVFTESRILRKFDEEAANGLCKMTLPITYNSEVIDTDVDIMIGRDTIFDMDVMYAVQEIYNCYILSLYPASEAFSQANQTIIYIMIIEVIVFTVLFIVLHLLIKRRVVRKLDSVNASLDVITGGDLDERVEVRDTYEFDTLSSDINATVDKLKEYIAEAAARIDADLAVAKAIQSSALPSVFPPFPEHKEFELFARMDAAKEVGGDFYDFYMLGDSTLGFLIADVSGKSIPGAMFMMTSKTVIKSLAESGLAPAEVFTKANEKLCEGNDAEMFVTAWLGYLDLKTGLVHIANAGHNPPLLIRDGKAEFVILKPGLMLAGMDGVRYTEQTLQLQKGDILYLYTDGVTEAMDSTEEQYGEERLQKLLSFGENCPAPSGENGIAGAVCDMVVADISKFTDGAEQSDDITMLCVRYLG